MCPRWVHCATAGLNEGKKLSRETPSPRFRSRFSRNPAENLASVARQIVMQMALQLSVCFAEAYVTCPAQSSALERNNCVTNLSLLSPCALRIPVLVPDKPYSPEKSKRDMGGAMRTTLMYVMIALILLARSA